MLAYISSNKWFRAGYGEKLRKHIADICHIHSITDFGDLPVFKSATAYPMIFICSNQLQNNQKSILAQVRSLDHPYPNIKEVIEKIGNILPAKAFAGANWSLTDSSTAKNIQQIESSGMTLGEYVKGEICREVVSGLTEAFVIDRETRDMLILESPESAEIIKPLVTN